MSLEFTDELLSAYLDGELSPAERAAVERQLAADPQARQLVEELRALSGEVRALPRYAAGETFSQRVVAAALAAQRAAAPLPRQDGEPKQDGEVLPAARAGASSLPGKARRGWRLPVVLAGAAAVAAAVALAVWLANPPVTSGPGPVTVVQGPGEAGESVTEPETSKGPAAGKAVEEALARLRQAIPQEGEGLVLRLRLAPGQSPSDALDAAFAAAGLGTRRADDDTTGAYSVASAYQTRLAEKTAGQPAEATVAAADAVFVTAPLDQLEKAIAALASRPQFPLSLEPLMSGRVVLEAEQEGEGPAAGPARPKHFAQRLPAGQFLLQKQAGPLAEITPPAAPRDPARPVRVLILVEP